MEQRLTNLNVWIWRYLENERNYPGLHFTADRAACETLRDVLRTLTAEGSGSHRTLLLKALNPEDEAKISGGRSFSCFSRLRVELSERSAELQFMSATQDGDVASRAHA